MSKHTDQYILGHVATEVKAMLRSLERHQWVGMVDTYYHHYLDKMNKMLDLYDRTESEDLRIKINGEATYLMDCAYKWEQALQLICGD